MLCLHVYVIVAYSKELRIMIFMYRLIRLICLVPKFLGIWLDLNQTIENFLKVFLTHFRNLPI